jgi:hypothetical protein
MARDGWGIRYFFRGWLFSVSGLSAIEPKMKNGRVYHIGTDDTEGFTKALEKVMNDLSGQ